MYVCLSLFLSFSLAYLLISLSISLSLPLSSFSSPSLSSSVLLFFVSQPFSWRLKFEVFIYSTFYIEKQFIFLIFFFFIQAYIFIRVGLRDTTFRQAI